MLEHPSKSERIKAGSSLPSLRLCLLIAVNAVIGVLLALMLPIDYRLQIADSIAEKQIAMDEEAKALLSAVRRLRSFGTERIRDYINEVCRQMQESSSPGHRIDVVLGDTVIESHGHDGGMGEVDGASIAAAHKLGELHSTKDHVVGRAEDADARVFVSERVSNIQRLARHRALQRLGAIILVVGAGAIVIDVLLLRLVAKPLDVMMRRVRGISEGDYSQLIPQFGTRELSVMATEINEMSYALHCAAEERRWQMNKARQIQENLLPKFPQLAGLKLASLYRPAEDVAGDYFDVVELTDGKVLLCVADVVGHGVPAAMMAVMLKTLVHHAIESLTDPAAILKYLNRRFMDLAVDGDFVSMFLAVWNPTTSAITYASAGHETAMLMSKGSGALQNLDSTGVLLGIAESNWETQQVLAEPGDRMVVVTDGLINTAKNSGERFGQKRLRELVFSQGNMPLDDLPKTIDQSIRSFTNGASIIDDITLVVAEIQ
ncbi:MAG TPA: SpoIIE family protein phosphatase [Thermoguttaceae bacterium]